MAYIKNFYKGICPILLTVKNLDQQSRQLIVTMLFEKPDFFKKGPQSDLSSVDQFWIDELFWIFFHPTNFDLLFSEQQQLSGAELFHWKGNR